MSQFKVDRELLEQNSTVEILRILRDEREDYTPEAISIFEDILRQRGVAGEHVQAAKSPIVPPKASTGRVTQLVTAGRIRRPADAIGVLNDILDSTLNKRIDSQTAQAAANIIMTMLRAMEMEFMQDGEEVETGG